MKKRALIFPLLILSLFACKKEEETKYVFSYGDKKYFIEGVRVLQNEKSDSSDLQPLKIYFYTKNVSFNVEAERGYGAFLKLELNAKSADLPIGSYQFENALKNFTITKGKRDENGKVSGSYFKILPAPKSENDTLVVPITSGIFEVAEIENGEKQFNIDIYSDKNEHISGSYSGSYNFLNNTDGAKVGEVAIGDSLYNLQRGDLVRWGKIFPDAPELNYFELFFYSTTLRSQENGKFQKGLVLVLGLCSTAEKLPATGDYTLSRKEKNFAAWSGRKEKNIDWGSYWYHYVSSSSYQKAFVNGEKISFSNENGKFKVAFNSTDQLGNAIRGEYFSDFKIIEFQ